MALSNILREPRREITETLVGLAIITPLIVCDYALARSLYSGMNGKTSQDWYVTFLLMAPMILAMGNFVVFVIAFAIHNVGEAVCDALERNGYRLRPIRRFR